MLAYAQVGSFILWSSEPKPREWCHPLWVTLPISISLKKMIILHGLGQRVIKSLTGIHGNLPLGDARSCQVDHVKQHRSPRIR